MLGQELDWSILDTRLAAFLPSLLLTALFFGGNEEPGWRGFALPRLQDRFSPVRSTLVFGAVWAPWHAPILFASDDASHGLGTGGVLVLVALTLLSIVGSLDDPGAARATQAPHASGPCAHDGAQPNPCRCGLSSRRPQDNRLPQARSARVHSDRAAKGRPAQAQGRRGAGSDVEGCA
jgi:hypothetical protein